MILHFFTDDYDTYVAETMEEAIALWAENTGAGEEDTFVEDWYQIPDGEMVPIYIDEDRTIVETKSAYEWALINGKGCLCSTEF